MWDHVDLMNVMHEDWYHFLCRHFMKLEILVKVEGFLDIRV